MCLQFLNQLRKIKCQTDILWGGIFCYINAIETRKHKLFSVKCCVNARWRQWCCWQGRKLDEESILSPEIWVIATLKRVSSPLAPTHPHSSITFQKEVQKLFPVPTTYIPSRMHTRSEFLFCYCKWEFRPYWFQAFFFFPFPAFRNTFFLKCSSDLQLPHTKAVNGFRLRHLHYLYLQRRRMNPEALAIMQTCSQSHCVSRCSLPQAVTNHVDGKPWKRGASQVDWMCTLRSHMLKPSPQCVGVFGGGDFERWFRSWSRILINEINALMKETSESSLAPSFHHVRRQRKDNRLWTRKMAVTRHQNPSLQNYEK